MSEAPRLVKHTLVNPHNRILTKVGFGGAVFVIQLMRMFSWSEKLGCIVYFIYVPLLELV